MGASSSVRNIPNDVTQCSMIQLEQMINSAIINNPWLVTEDDADSTDQENLKRIVDMMSRKGLRPITPEEYAAKLKTSRGKNSGKGSINLWRLMNGQEIPSTESSMKTRCGGDASSDCNTYSSSVSFTNESLENRSLPTTKEEAANIFEEFRVNSQESAAEYIDTQCDTLEWGATVCDW